MDIREYFQKDYNKEMFPTKKGVSLSLEIWSSLLSKAKEINLAIEEMQSEQGQPRQLNKSPEKEDEDHSPVE